MTSVSGAASQSYEYDGHGRRVWVRNADGSSQLQLYSQAGQLLWSRKLNASAAVQQDTLTGYLDGKAVVEVSTGSAAAAAAATATGVNYLHTDGLGSPVLRTDASGVVKASTQYDPWGDTWAGDEPSSLGFTGHVNDATSGLVYMQQRYYDPVAGRFLSVDPVVTNANSGKSFGRYHYANNNPYRYVDGDGRDAIGFLVKLLDNGGKVFLKQVDKAEAVAARRAGQNVQAATKSDAKQIEIAARNGDKGGIMQHKGHELKDGSTGDPHFQTEGVEGHTFWGSQSGAVLPELLEALLIPILATPTSLAPGTLYGAGTPYKNQEEYDNAMKEKDEKRKQDEEKKPKPEDKK